MSLRLREGEFQDVQQPPVSSSRRGRQAIFRSLAAIDLGHLGRTRRHGADEAADVPGLGWMTHRHFTPFWA